MTNSLNCINITVPSLLSTPNFLYQVPKISIPYCQNVQECRGRFRNVVKCSHTMFNKQHNKGICHNVSPSVPGRLLAARGILTAFSIPLCSFSLITCGILFPSHHENGPHFGREMGNIG